MFGTVLFLWSQNIIKFMQSYNIDMCLKYRCTLQRAKNTSDVHTCCLSIRGHAKLSLLTVGMTTDRSKDCSCHVQRLGLRHAHLCVLHTYTHARTHTRKTCYDLLKRDKRFKIKQGV